MSNININLIKEWKPLLSKKETQVLTTNVNYLNVFFTIFQKVKKKRKEETLNRDIADESISGRSWSNY